VKNYIGAYVINLEENKDRKKAFLDEWNNINEKINFVKAVDTRIHLWKYYKDSISKEAIKKLRKSIKSKERENHADLTEGSIGCYLSHLKCWKKFLKESKSQDDYCLILEDDSSVPKNLFEITNKIIKEINAEWGAILLGWMATSEYLPFNEDLLIPGSHQLSHAYLLSNFGVKKLLEIHDKIEIQLDHFMSNNIKEVKIFGTIEDVCVQKNSCGYSNIQNYPCHLGKE